VCYIYLHIYYGRFTNRLSRGESRWFFFSSLSPSPHNRANRVRMSNYLYIIIVLQLYAWLFETIRIRFKNAIDINYIVFGIRIIIYHYIIIIIIAAHTTCVSTDELFMMAGHLLVPTVWTQFTYRISYWWVFLRPKRWLKHF